MCVKLCLCRFTYMSKHTTRKVNCNIVFVKIIKRDSQLVWYKLIITKDEKIT